MLNDHVKEVSEWIPVSSPCESCRTKSLFLHQVLFVIFDYTTKTWIRVATLVSIPKVKIDETLRTNSGKTVDLYLNSIRAKGR